MNGRTDTYWFDVPIAALLLMLGNLSFGRFVEHRPRWRRLKRRPRARAGSSCA